MHTYDPTLVKVGKAGRAAWQRLQKDKTFEDWLTFGRALVDGRRWAMHEAGANRPMGSAYTKLFGDYLDDFKLRRPVLDGVDREAANRSRLFELMDNLPEIVSWRATLTPEDRAQWNHPNTVLRNWKRLTQPRDPRTARRGPSPAALREDVALLQDELRGAEQRAREALDERAVSIAVDERVAMVEAENAELRRQVAELQAELTGLRKVLDRVQLTVPS